MNLSAVVVPQVTCDLPVAPVAYDPSWSHLNEIRLAYPKLGVLGRVVPTCQGKPNQAYFTFVLYSLIGQLLLSFTCHTFIHFCFVLSNSLCICFVI